MDYPPISDYGIIGNLKTVALVGKGGAIDFLCLPQFDSPSVFAALLDKSKGGHFSVCPQFDHTRYKQLYLPNTNVLLTRFLSSQGMVEITDFMPVLDKDDPDCILIRLVTCIRGEANLKMECVPRFNYARSAHTIKHRDGEQYTFYCERAQDPILSFYSTRPLDIAGKNLEATFLLREKETACFVLETGTSYPNSHYGQTHALQAYADWHLRKTIDYWKSWIAQSTYQGEWLEMVRRSALTLKLLTSQKWGSTVAAPTFGLPEAPGGERNWDYRYTWIRDAAFTMYAFLRLGFKEESREFMHWIWKQFQLNIDGQNNLQLLYALDGRKELPEEELSHLEGYQKSKPVRIGNDAYRQIQLDIFGELLDSIYLHDKYVSPMIFDFWEQLITQVDFVCDHWQEKDHGIWEIRSEKQEFIYSRIMCWVAVDRAIRLAEKRSLPYPFGRWRAVRDEIYRDVYYNFWNEQKQSFVQYKGSDIIDASVLIMPLVRYISPYDPRWQATLKAVEKELVSDTLVYRYDTRYAADGLGSQEGTFSICSFWYVECLARGGELHKAQLYFEKMIGYASPLGLFAEQISLEGEQIGNYPQAFTHLSLISAAFALNKLLKEK